jgi:hypothetical protein
MFKTKSEISWRKHDTDWWNEDYVLQNCEANVICIQGEKGVMYPLGAACQQAEWCRNSITGVCADNCSAAICMEEVPSGRLWISFLLPEKTNLRQSYVIYFCVDSFLFVLLILVELVTVTIYTFRIEYIMVRTVINLSNFSGDRAWFQI